MAPRALTRRRVVVVTTSFPAHEGDPSGHFVEADALARAADADVHVIAPGGDPSSLPERRGRLFVHAAGGGALFGWPGAAARLRERPARLVAALPFALAVERRLARLVRQAPVDLAVAHWIVPSAVPLLTRFRGPLEVFAHGADVRLLGALPAPLRARVVGSLLRRGARLRFASRSLLEALEAGLPPALAAALARAARVEPAPIAVDLAGAEPPGALRAALGVPRGAALFLFAGRLVATKRAELAIEALAALGLPDARLALAGDGPELPRLEALAARLAPGRVLFLGRLSRPDLLALLRAADALVHPSSTEAAPTVVREARALGVPVVACPAGDLALWAASDPGITLVAPDARSLASALAGCRRSAEG